MKLSPITLSLNCVLIFLEENLCWSPLGLKRVDFTGDRRKTPQNAVFIATRAVYRT